MAISKINEIKNNYKQWVKETPTSTKITQVTIISLFAGGLAFALTLLITTGFGAVPVSHPFTTASLIKAGIVGGAVVVGVASLSGLAIYMVRRQLDKEAQEQAIEDQCLL